MVISPLVQGLAGELRPQIYFVGEKFFFHRGGQGYDATVLGGGGSEFFWFHVEELGWIVRDEPELMGERDGQKYYFSYS